MFSLWNFSFPVCPSSACVSPVLNDPASLVERDCKVSLCLNEMVCSGLGSWSFSFTPPSLFYFVLLPFGILYFQFVYLPSSDCNSVYLINGVFEYI